jgi:hypothetical protein
MTFETESARFIHFHGFDREWAKLGLSDEALRLLQMSKRDPIGKTKAARGDADLSPRWREAVDELGKLRDALAAGEPVENHFRVDVVASDPAFSELLAALRLERERLGLSLGEVARRTGIDTGDLSRLENGKDPDPSSSTLRRYARALGKRLSWSLEEAE